MNILKFLPRKLRPAPATASVHTDNAPPPWRVIEKLPMEPAPRPLAYYEPKRHDREPAAEPPVDISMWLASLTGERRRRAMNLLRHGYGIGRPVAAAPVVQLRMAA
jgi:hypothetical protein